jgi:hypothetical protein
MYLCIYVGIHMIYKLLSTVNILVYVFMQTFINIYIILSIYIKEFRSGIEPRTAKVDHENDKIKSKKQVISNFSSNTYDRKDDTHEGNNMDICICEYLYMNICVCIYMYVYIYVRN